MAARGYEFYLRVPKVSQCVSVVSCVLFPRCQCELPTDLKKRIKFSDKGTVKLIVLLQTIKRNKGNPKAN